MISLLHEDIDRYVHDHTENLGPLFDELREETLANLAYPQMQVGRVEGQFLRTMVAVSGARRVLEIGTYSGYSALAMASALPDDGVLITCDIDPVATAVAQRYFDRAPWGHRIELRLGPALETMKTLQKAGARFDLVFIDADKINYPHYVNAAVDLMDPGKLILVDNTLWSGAVLSPETDDARAIRDTNAQIAADPRLEQVLLSVRDGIMMARIRGGD